MWQYRLNPSSNELYHYGILGMKWGKHKRYDTVGKNGGKSDKPENANKKKSGLSDRQKTALKIGAAVAVTTLAVYGLYRLNKSGKLKELINLGKKQIELDESTGFKKIGKSKVDISDINVGHSNPFDTGRHMNCGNCTIAYELQSRGLDVSAKSNPNGMYPEQFGRYFSGLHEKSIKTLRPDLDEDVPSLESIRKLGDSKILSAIQERGRIFEEKISSSLLNSYPEGSRGNIYVPMTNGNHFFSWSIKNGKTIFEDPQIPLADIRDYFSAIDMSTNGGKRYGVRTMRFDDLKINTDHIRQIVKSRISDGSLDIRDFNVNDIFGDGFSMQMIS